MAVYLVADINQDSDRTWWVASHNKQGASYKEFCSYWPFYERSSLQLGQLTAHAEANSYMLEISILHFHVNSSYLRYLLH